MKMLITVDELREKSSRDLIPIECEICNDVFYKPKNVVLRGLKGTRSVSACGNECRKKLISKRRYLGDITLTCVFCKKNFQRSIKVYKKWQLKNNKVSCCSRKCASKWQYENGLSKNMRSSLEKWVEEKIKERFPELKVVYNDRNTIDGELDIFIPIFNLAFELNGICHYKPIYGRDKLEKKVVKDFEKSIDCFSKQIELHVLDCREYDKLNENRDMKYIDYIFDVIKRKIEESERIPDIASRT